MLVSDLARLMESGDYKRCLEEATLLLATGGHDAESRVRIQAAICKCRLELTDFFAAVEAGRLAVEMASEAQLADVVGFSLIDLGRARAEIRQYDAALEAFERFFQELPIFTAARCMEGIALRHMAGTLHKSGRHNEALERYLEARRWFLRFGDVKTAAECSRSAVHLHLEQGAPEYAIPLLKEGDRYAEAHPQDREFLTDHLLDRAIFLMVVGQHQESIQEAFRALYAADDRLDHQCRAHLILSQNALALNQPKDALSFALAARVAAIDGRCYDLEFEASDILFRLLRGRGARLLEELECDYYEQRVDLYHYLSERVVRRMVREN